MDVEIYSRMVQFIICPKCKSELHIIGKVRKEYICCMCDEKLSVKNNRALVG